MIDWGEYLTLAKAAIAKAEQELSLGRSQAGIDALMDARLKLWHALDAINQQMREREHVEPPQPWPRPGK